MAQKCATMDDTPEGEFEWKIDRFNEILSKERQLIASPVFKCRGWKCHLFIPERDSTCNLCLRYYPFYLAGVDFFQLSNKPLTYKLSFIGRRRKKFLETQYQTLQIFPPYFLLTVIQSTYLELNRNDLMPDGTLTFHLSWYETKDTKCIPDTPEAFDQSSENELVTLFETLSKDFSHFYESKMDTDCVVRVGEAQFPVHRQVLSARSDVFGAMFRHDTSENRSGVVDILDVDAAVMSDILQYIYSGQVHGLTSDSAVPMYVVADKYALVELKDVCLDFLIHHLTIENFCAAALLAHTHGEMCLEAKIVQFMEDRLEEVKESEGFKTLSNTKPSLAIDLLCSTVFACKEKTQNKI